MGSPQSIVRGFAVLVLLAGLAISAITASVVAEYEREQSEAEFNHRIQQATNTIAARLSLYIAVVQAAQGLYAASDDVTNDDWRHFSEVWRDSATLYPGLGPLQFVRYFDHSERPPIEIDPPGERDYYCPVVYIHPVPTYPPFIGFDLCMRPISKIAMMAGREQGRIIMTGRVLVSDQVSGELLPGVVIYGPVYERDGQIHGWATLPLFINDIMADVLPDSTMLSLRLYDGDIDHDQLLYAIGTPPDDQQEKTEEIRLAGRNWTLVFTEPAVNHDITWLVLVAGFIITLLLALLLWRAGGIHARALVMAERMTTAFRSSEERYRTIISSLEDAYFETDLAGDLQFFNEALVRLLGYGTRELQGMNNRDYMDATNADKVFAAFNRVYETGDSERGVQWEVTCKNGDKRYVEASISVIRDDEGNPLGFRGIARDITERRRADERIHYLAHYDALTGLPNRSLFEDRLSQALKRRWRGNDSAALLFLDLDRFKTVNDSLGHHTGDRLLQLVAQRIQDSVREGDTVCRPGGDEFMVLLPDLGQPSGAAQVASKILQAVAHPYNIDKWELSVTPSIGIAVIPQDGDDIDTLTRNADTAMYHAKESGRNNFQFFTTGMNEDADKRLALEHGLRQALERDEFELHYQPIVEAQSGRITGAEALIRWNRPGHGVLPAGVFIGVIEQSGLILSVGEWVLETACRQAKSWDIPIAVNLSGLQFRQHGLRDTITRVLQRTGLEPSGLELEMTESVLIQDAMQTIDTVNELHELGIRFSVDDFGTGYSSLSYLKRFPIDRVKIDRSFVRDLTSDPDDAVIVDAIVSMARSLRMEVVAEGVETVEQRDYLRQQGCHFMQGYLFSRPVSAAEFERLLKA